MAECGVSLFLGQDPHKSVNWDTSGRDNGYDLAIKNQHIEVKSSNSPYASRLMWPVTRVNELRTTPFHLFVFTRVLSSKSEPLGQPVDLAGWITKEKFMAHHWVANGLRGIIDGTPFMHEKQLDPIETLMKHIQVN